MINGMPRPAATIGRWSQKFTFYIRVQSVVDALVTYNLTEVVFRGTLQPLSAKQIELKPEGQRAWTWLRLQCFTPAPFNVNDQVVYNNQTYKVMAQNDYTLSGYMEYHLVQDYQS